MGEKNEHRVTRFYQSQFFKEITERNPIVLIDIGARGGIAQKWEPFRSSIKVIGFEPDENECRRLNETVENNRIYLPIALFNKKGKIRLNLTRNPACYSTYEPNYTLINRFLDAEEYEVTGTIDVQCDTLDEVISNADVQEIDFIKLDTQGSELQVLEGAENSLSQFCVFGVEIEVEFSSLYKDQPLFADVDSFLRDRGFVLFDIKTPLGRKVRKTVTGEPGEWKGQGLWGDALYLRDLVSERDKCPEVFTLETAIKTIAIAEFHGFGDFALELLDNYLHKGIVGDSEYGNIRRMLLLSGEGKFRPELKLYLDIKKSMGEYLHDRFPSIYKFIVKILSNKDSIKTAD